MGISYACDDSSDLDKWEIPRHRVVINRKLGEGAFGTVYGGEAFFPEKGWLAVAVKTLKIGSSTEEKLDFLSEVEVMKQFDHKNIIKLLGVCIKSEPVLTVMEFMLYGDLKTYLLARRHLVNNSYEDSDEISNKKLTAMALDVARALSYLAQSKYVHRDIASRNCLVNAQRIVKLGDFGMTRLMYENDYYKFNRRGMLPVRWMAPESLGLGIFTPASDVWSYLKMFLTRSEYDHGVNTFSPEGRLFQVEYAIEAIKLGSTAIGIATSEGVVLVVEKRITSSLMEPTTVEKIVEIDKHIGCAASGLIADSRTMIDRARVECQNHWFVYNERMSVESTAQAVSNLAIQFGDSDDDGSAMSRPFGVAMLFAGIDEKGPQLYHMDPSGTFVQFDAKAIGSGNEGAQQNLQEVYHKSMTLQEAIKAALVILKQVMEEKLSDNNIEVMTMTPEKLFHMFTKAELQEVIKDIA